LFARMIPEKRRGNTPERAVQGFKKLRINGMRLPILLSQQKRKGRRKKKKRVCGKTRRGGGGGGSLILSDWGNSDCNKG